MSTEWKQGAEAPPETLPFSEKKQNALLGHLLTKARFFQQALPHVKPGWFLHPFNQKIWSAMTSFHKEYGRAPKKDEIIEAPSAVVEDQGTKNRLRAHAGECLVDAEHIGYDVLEKELTEWMHARVYFQGMVKSNQLYHAQNLKDALAEIRNVSKVVEEVKFGGDDEFDPTNYADLFKAEEAELEDALSTGSSALDSLLNPSAKSGSLLKGDLTCLLGGVNAGKTRTMVSIACHNAKARKKNVLLVAHEDRKMGIFSGIWCHFLSNPAAGQFMDQKLLLQTWGTPAMRRKMDIILEAIWKRHFVYMPMMRAGLTVEEVVNAIRRKQDEFAARHNGEGFDLILDDYPAKLRTEIGAGGKLENRHREAIVYQMFRDLASELNNHGIVAGQVNREANKKMKGLSQHHKERELLTMEDKEEAWGPMQSAVNVISINRDDEAKRRQCVTYGLCKSRSGETGYAVVCGSRLGAYVTHDDALGATWYRNGKSYSHIVDDLLRQYAGREIDPAALQGD